MALDNAGDIAAGRARRDRLELLVGLGAALLLAVLVVLALVGRQHPKDGGYPLHAAFSHIDGLGVGSDVRLAGVTVGHVRSMDVDPHSFQAEIVFSVAPDIQLPADSGAVITSDSLLGGKYVALTPGGDTEMLKPGGTIGETQGAISLEQLLSKFIFSVTDSLQKKTGASSAPAPALEPSAPSQPVLSDAPARQATSGSAASVQGTGVQNRASSVAPTPAPAPAQPASPPSSGGNVPSSPVEDNGLKFDDPGVQVEMPAFPSAVPSTGGTSGQ